MANNTILNPGTGGDTIATNDVSGVKYQVVKLDVGGDGASLPLSTSNPIPINLVKLGGTSISLGQTTMSGSIPIVFASDQSSIPVTQSGTWNISNLSGTVSTNNSSTTTLGGNAIFTGTSEDVSAYQEVRVSVISNVASATDGLSIQQSSDGTNWDITDTYTIPAATGKTFAVARDAKFFRVVYTNGGSAQGSFRLQTIFNKFGTGMSSQRASDAYTNETDLTQNWSFNSLYNGSTWDRMRGDITNGLDVDVTRVSGNITVVQATGSNLLAQVSNNGTFAVQSTPVTQADTFMLGGVNIKEINAVTPLMGNGITGTGSLRVTIASDNTAFSVNAASTLTAETTKVIGTVRNVGNAGANFDGATAASVPANALLEGARAATAYPTAVTDGQMVGVMADKAGRIVTAPKAPRDLIGTQNSLNSSSSSAVSFIAAGASGVFNDICTLVITNESSTATIVTLSDNGSGGNTYKFAIAANGGISVNFDPPLPQGTSAAAWDVLNSAGVALDYMATWVKNK